MPPLGSEDLRQRIRLSEHVCVLPEAARKPSFFSSERGNCHFKLEPTSCTCHVRLNYAEYIMFLPPARLPRKQQGVPESSVQD
jgi:hypothetical protein